MFFNLLVYWQLRCVLLLLYFQFHACFSLIGLPVCVCVCTRGEGNVMYSTEQPLFAPVRPKSIWWRWSLAERFRKAWGHPGKKRLESRETGGRMRRIVSEGRRIALWREVVCLLHNLPPPSLFFTNKCGTSCYQVIDFFTLRFISFESQFSFVYFQLMFIHASACHRH